jgi:hypothetical protein
MAERELRRKPSTTGGVAPWVTDEATAERSGARGEM